MGLGEADTRAKLIDPALHARGWTEDLIRREETAGAIEMVDGRPRRRARGRIDYVLRVRVNAASQPVAVALIEAKAEGLPPNHGLEQAKALRRLQAPQRPVRLSRPTATSSSSTTGVTGLTTRAASARRVPDARTTSAPATRRDGLQPRIRRRPGRCSCRYPGGEGTRRYYQDAAIRAVLEKLARGEKRALLSLATGAGKTYIAVNLLRKIADAGQLRRALFVCDRDELRSQALDGLPERVRRRRRSRVGRQPSEERPHPDRHLPDPRRRHGRGRRASSWPRTIRRTTSATSSSTSATARPGASGPRC